MAEVEPPPRSNRGLLVKLAVVAIVLIAGIVLVARGYDVKGLLEQAQAVVRSAGPGVFFTAQALLPAVGFPQSAFNLPAGSLFGAQLGLPLVVLLSSLATTVNMMLAYWMASRLVRPLCEWLVRRLGYQPPQVKAGDTTDLIVLLRVAGLPFPVQNYLLGLAQVPFGKYMLISVLIVLPTNAAFVLFGDALLQGKGKLALAGLFAITALGVGTHLLRKHYSKKKAA